MSKHNDGCVKLKRNSWHYKVTDYVFPYMLDSPYKSFNLCPYLRMVIAAAFSYPFMLVWNKFPYGVKKHAGLFQAEFIFLFSVVGMAILLDFVDTFEETEALPPVLDMIAIGFFGGNLVGIGGGLIIYGFIKLIDYLKHRPKTEHRTTGLLKAYVHAKHNKICPCVEFVDDEEDLR